MRKSRNKMQPEISPGTPEEVGLVQKRVIITDGAVVPSYQVLHEDQRGTVTGSSAGLNVLLF